jgi:CRISPR-associated protein Cmr5
MSETPRSHRTAQAAYDRVEARLAFEEKKAYGALAHKLPVLVLQNGLAQATGFLLAKGKDEHIALLGDLARVLGYADAGANKAHQSLHEAAINADTSETMRLTRRALEASGWIKRCVQGVLKVDATGEENTHA